MPRVRTIIVCFLLLVSTVGWSYAQETPPQQPKPVVVNFFVGVDTASLNQLIVIVDNQIRAGAKKITILVSSIGGDPAAAFTAYNYLRGIPAEVTTVNMGNVDSAAAILYCAGKHRYTLDGTRFLLHGVSIPVQANSLINAQDLENNLSLVKNRNQMIARVLAANTNKEEVEITDMLRGQTILNPEDAKKWGLVDEVRKEFLEPGATLVTLLAPPSQTVPIMKPAGFRTLPATPVTPQWQGLGQAPEASTQAQGNQ